MVVGERFAWAHLPKTGGDTTRTLFGLFPGLVLFADPGDTNEKHAIFRDREQLDSAPKLASSSLPDARLAYFTSGRWVRIDRWLRLEHLREDFLDFASEIAAVDPRRAREAHELPALDVAEYDREPRNWFSEAQLGEMYRRNPLWGALERQLYGDLLIDPSARGSIRSVRVDS